MSEREKEILLTIDRALPHMTDFEKGYLLGVAENVVNRKRDQQHQQESEKKAG